MYDQSQNNYHHTLGIKLGQLHQNKKKKNLRMCDVAATDNKINNSYSFRGHNTRQVT
jgi:hypothetical protein